MGGRFKKEGTYVYPIHVDVWQKPKQYCKAITLQLKANELKVKNQSLKPIKFQPRMLIVSAKVCMLRTAHSTNYSQNPDCDIGLLLFSQAASVVNLSSQV